MAAMTFMSMLSLKILVRFVRLFDVKHLGDTSFSLLGPAHRTAVNVIAHDEVAFVHAKQCSISFSHEDIVKCSNVFAVSCVAGGDTDCTAVGDVAEITWELALVVDCTLLSVLDVLMRDVLILRVSFLSLLAMMPISLLNLTSLCLLMRYSANYVNLQMLLVLLSVRTVSLLMV